MLPAFLVPESVVEANGQSPAFDLGANPPRRLLVTLGITQVAEQESLDLALLASADGETWTHSPVLEFPQKFYVGASTLLLDLSRHPGLRYLRARWTLNRWGRGDQKPLFTLYIFLESTAAKPAPQGKPHSPAQSKS